MLNIPNSSQEGIVQERATEQNGPEVNSEPIFTFPPIAGFWRRFLAWLIDCLLLGAIWPIADMLLSPLLVMIAYFGILNSKISGGRTIGKWLFRIAVRNKNNEPIGLVRSFIRSIVLTMPILFLGSVMQTFNNRVIAWSLFLLFFGLGGAILYTMIFNREARQGIHDLLVGTYVVHLPGKPIGSFPTTSRVHYKNAGLWVGFVAIIGLTLVWIGPHLLDAYWANAPRRPLPYDCLALMKDKSVVALSNVTYTAYRSNDGGITWSRDTTIDAKQSTLDCSWDWPATVGTEPPINFYYMEDLGIYQSLDDGETLAFTPVDLGEGDITPEAVVTSFDTLIVSVGGGNFWLRLPSGEWIQYKEKSPALLLEPVTK